MPPEFFSRDASRAAGMHTSPPTIAVDPLAASRSFEPGAELRIRLRAIAFLIVVDGDVHPRLLPLDTGNLRWRLPFASRKVACRPD